MHVRGALAALGLTGFAKTTGGKGVHVVVPIRETRDWKAVHAATGAIAERIAAGAPGTFTTVMGAANRKRRIFIDFHRNARSATAVAPYSLRARNNLPASAPLSWEISNYRRSGGFELFFASGSGRRHRRSLGRDRGIRRGLLSAPERVAERAGKE